jgi:ABC-2 type transport system permease protein
MAKLWVVIKREYLERVRTKWFLIATIFGPLFFGSLMILPSYLSARTLRDAKVGNLRILDATGTGLGARVAAKMAVSQQAMGSATQVITLTSDALAEAESTATHAVMQKKDQGYLVLDSTTFTQLTARYAGSNASSIGETQLVETAVRQSLLQTRLEQAGLDPRRVDSLTKVRVNMSVEKIDEKGRGGSGLASAIFGFLIAFLLYFSIIFYGQNIMSGVLDEKVSRVSEVVLSSVGPDTLLAGKVIGVGAVGLTQQAAWIGSTALLWNARAAVMAKLGVPMISITLPPIGVGMLLLLVAYFILGYLLYASLFAAVGAMSGDQQEARQASQPVIMLLAAAIIFAQPVMFAPTSTLAKVVSLLPVTAPIIMPLRMSATQVPALEIAISLAGVAIACAAAIWASARIYRVGLLMTGKRPTLQELGRWIRYS